MNRKLAVAEPFLTEKHRKMIREAAEKHGFEVRIINSPEEDRNFLNEAEVIFGQTPETAKVSNALKWICTPFAGVDKFLAWRPRLRLRLVERPDTLERATLHRSDERHHYGERVGS